MEYILLPIYDNVSKFGHWLKCLPVYANVISSP